MKLSRPFLLLALCGLILPSLLCDQPAQKAVVSPTGVPDWQIAAGGNAQFDVASVKSDNATPSQQTVTSNIPLGPMDAFTPTGGLFSVTNYPLIQYITFAYKLRPEQVQAVRAQLPKWANKGRYDIEGRTSGNPTKDQFRLMMQALLADRFKLAIHYEIRQLPVMALVLDRPGKLGPQLRPHPNDSHCSTAPVSSGAGFPTTISGGFPETCSAVQPMQPSVPGRFRAGGRDVFLAMFAPLINSPQLTGIDRPVFDKTGLTGKFDFVVEWTPQITGPLPPDAQKPDSTGPTFLEALKDQLGLKLVPETGPVDVLFVDHIEEPTPN